MKKIIVILFTLLLSLTVISCSKEKDTEGSDNSITYYDSLEEINKAVDVKLESLGVMGVSDEKYSIINGTIADYSFTLNGLKYSLRASHDLKSDITFNDVCGVESEDGNISKFTYYFENVKIHQFAYDNVQYAMIIDDPENTVTNSMFDNYYTEFENIIYANTMDESLSGASGTFYDTENKAVLLTDPVSSDTLNIRVILPTSKDTTSDFYDMTCKFVDKKLKYDESTLSTYKDGAMVDSNEGAGYFEYKNGIFTWTISNAKGEKNYSFRKLDVTEHLIYTTSGVYVLAKDFKTKDLIGSYTDSISQRASMDVTESYTDYSLDLMITWANDAESLIEWKMTIFFDGEKYIYNDCMCSEIKFVDGTDETTTLYENGEGYFEIKYNKFYWTGASEEYCNDCIFEQGEILE